jgi:hypothetical protein
LSIFRIILPAHWTAAAPKYSILGIEHIISRLQVPRNKDPCDNCKHTFAAFVHSEYFVKRESQALLEIIQKKDGCVLQGIS